MFTLVTIYINRLNFCLFFKNIVDINIILKVGFKTEECLWQEVAYKIQILFRFLKYLTSLMRNSHNVDMKRIILYFVVKFAICLNLIHGCESAMLLIEETLNITD